MGKPWTVGGSRLPTGNSCRYRKNMQTPQREAPARSQTRNFSVVK